MTVPEWVQDAVFYQIFPDRFANGDVTNDPANVQPWGTIPTMWGFQGGDFAGLIQQFEYLTDLGINAVYLNPIFLATSTHRYNTTNYFEIDPKLGNLQTFKSFLQLAHESQVKVILDGVFNHCGRGFFAFNDILENQQHSPYKDWFHIKKYPVNAYQDGKAEDYLGWWGYKSLPKFNTDNPQARKYLLDVAAYWIEQGIDGWRLDVPNEIDDDEFWKEFRTIVKSINPQAYILGEIWDEDIRWVGEEHFDGLMNYPFRNVVLELLQEGGLTGGQFMERCVRLFNTYPQPNVHAMYVPLGSHDTTRLLTKLGGDQDRAFLAFLLQFTFPGAPAVYYGDEIGLLGGKDPLCRAAFPWEREQWDHKTRDWIKQLIALRKSQPTLRRGDFRPLKIDGQDACCAFVREYMGDTVMVAVNASPTSQQLEIPVSELRWTEGSQHNSLLDSSSKGYTIQDGKISLSLQPWGGKVIA